MSLGIETVPVVISSRTPEGLPGRCPLCGNAVHVDPSPAFGDVPCPNCGHLLWFLAFTSETRLLLPEDNANVRERVLDITSEMLGIDRESISNDPSSLEPMRIDSLDIAELVMRLEEEFE